MTVRRPGWLVWILTGLVAAATLTAGGFALLATLLLRPGPAEHPTTLVIPPGTTVKGIGTLLRREGVIRADVPFSLGVRVLAANRPLQAGEFEFPARVSALSAIRILQDSAPLARRLTVPEGATVAEVVALLADIDELNGELGEVPDEGTLLPETYHYTRGDTPDQLIARMSEAMDRTLAELWPSRAENLPLQTPREAVILASIVERETSLASERAMVAGVFINRLRMGMLLQADPTVAYAVSGGTGLDRALTVQDLRYDSPYNTYLYPGLPPGPIANPGRAALEAAMRPAATSALYFVADGKGGHAFADTLAEHNANVARYRNRAQ